MRMNRRQKRFRTILLLGTALPNFPTGIENIVVEQGNSGPVVI
jgi:hypothetical protein